MIDRLAWLGLAAADPSGLLPFYRDRIGLEEASPQSMDVFPEPDFGFRVGGGSLVVRPLTALPGGGVHTHFAIEVSPGRYESLKATLGPTARITERTFGGNRSLYVTDPAGHCPEFGERPGTDGIGDIFEVVLEVRSIDRAVDRFRSVGFETVDRGHNRQRVRLRGPFDLELWEPHLGIAGARGGVHVDLGLEVDDVEEVASRLAGSADVVDRRDGAVTVRDADGHLFTLNPATDGA